MVYRNHKPAEKKQDQGANNEQMADNLEKEYQEKIRKANMEMRKQHGDEMDID